MKLILMKSGYKVSPHYLPLDKDDIVINNFFEEQYLNTKDYRDAQIKTTQKVLENCKELTQEKINNFVSIKENYFKSPTLTAEYIESWVCDIVNVSVYAEHYQKLVAYVTPIFTKMPDEILQHLLTFSAKYPHLVYLVFQPAFIYALGFHSFQHVMPILCHKGNFVKLIHYCIHPASSYFKLLTKGLFIGACTMVPFAVNMLFAYNGTPNPALTVMPEEVIPNVTDKEVSSARAGGPISENVNYAGLKARTVVAEASAFLTLAISGLPGGVKEALTEFFWGKS